MSEFEDEDPLITITPDEDDIASFREQSQRGRSPVSSAGRGSSSLITGVLLVVIAALGAAGYKLYTELEQATAFAAQDRDRIASLESRISNTSESVTQQGSEVETVLKELDSEVRKLWDNVWKRSKERLSEHDDKLTDLEKNQIQQQKTFVALQSALLSSQKALITIESQLTGHNERLVAAEALAKSLANQKSLLTELETGIKAQQQRNLDSERRIAELEGTLLSMEARVKENEEWLDSNNKFRQLVIRDIRTIKGRLDNLNQEQSAEGG